MAEVLITLGIIGIVAALTIPNLMGAYKKRVVSTELQRAFSIISNTIKMSEVYNESAAYWSYPTEGAGSSSAGNQQTQEFVDIYIKPYLKYTWSGQVEQIIYYADGTISNSTPYVSATPQFVMPDGIFLQFRPIVHTDNRGYVMIVNVGTTNGHKKNEFIHGKNFFSFTLNVDESSSKVGLEPQWYLNWSCQKLETNRENYIKNCYKNERETSGVPSSIYCTYMIYCNGWEIPDDYPIKF